MKLVKDLRLIPATGTLVRAIVFRLYLFTFEYLLNFFLNHERSYMNKRFVLNVVNFVTQSGDYLTVNKLETDLMN